MHFNKRTILENRATVLIKFRFPFRSLFSRSIDFEFSVSFQPILLLSLLPLSDSRIRLLSHSRFDIHVRELFTQNRWKTYRFTSVIYSNGMEQRLFTRKREREREIFHVLTWFRRNAQAFLTVVRYFENAEFAHCRD